MPCAKTINSLFFATILMKHENEKKEIVLLLREVKADLKQHVLFFITIFRLAVITTIHVV